MFSLDYIKISKVSTENDFVMSWDFLGQVYKGIVPGTGQKIAVKRAQEDSLQGAQEFKNEIELLSRVHHRNLVGLVGFCYENGEQMLVYEFMSGGTLTQLLRGKNLTSYLLCKTPLKTWLKNLFGLCVLSCSSSFHVTPHLVATQ